MERFGRIDTFVNSVMVTVYAEVEQLEPDELRRILDVNFMGRALSYRAALPHLKASRGTFIDVNSGLAYRGIPLQAAYCASKAAGRAYFESARVELEKHKTGVDLCLVLPGAVNTPLGAEALAARRRPRPAAERLEGADHRRAEARRLARQPLGDAARRPGSARPLRRALARVERLEGGPPASR